MCGIVGYTGSYEKDVLKNMLKSISHRGPDDNGIYQDDLISLGHQRLSIIDLSPAGRNPLCNEDQSIWITFNGEIYNYMEIKEDLIEKGHQFSSKTDTEVAIHAYEEFGIEFLNKINGMFAFALWDDNKKELFLVRDRIGIKPLYYSIHENNIIFASELKSILKSGIIPRRLDYFPLRDLLTLRSSDRERTFIHNIKKILPGNYLKYSLKEKNFVIQPYWQLSKSTNKSSIPLSSFVTELRNLIVSSVKKRLMSEVPLGVYLSGGLDSSSIIGIMHNLGIESINTFSIGFGQYDINNALNQAEIVANEFATDHHEIIVDPDIIKILPKIVWHCDEPLADPTVIPTYILSEHTKPNSTVVLTGEGADELFGGYTHYKFMNLRHNYFRWFPYPLRYLGSSFLNIMPSKMFQLLFKYSEALGKEGKRRAALLIKCNNPYEWYLTIQSIFMDLEKKEVLNIDYLQSKEKSVKIEDFNYSNYIRKYFINNKKKHFLNQALFFDQSVPLIEDLLMKVDKMTMSYSIEARVPFLDHNIVEFSSKIPLKYKFHKGKGKYILREALKPFIPPKTYQQKKDYFFVPIHRWFETELKTITENVLFGENSSNTFKKSFIRKIMTKYNQSPLYYARQLWTLLIFELWYQMYILPTDDEFNKASSINSPLLPQMG
ncbi:MAG: asparagine synthase (glutamine-hydrolyzing) [Candidatus Hodarchaeales archaeon]|jgi:asparagine synthase (glutamine-hydrolysing)